MKKSYYFTVPSYFYKDDPFPYDHPTKISKLKELETISRLVNSIDNTLPKNASAKLFIVMGFTEEKGINISKVEEEFGRIINKKRTKPNNLDIYIVNKSFVETVSQLAEKHKIKVSNNFYGNIRNLQLILQIVLGYKYQINLDDDEVIVNEEFYHQVGRATDLIQKSKRTGGIGGFYTKEDGSVDISKSPEKKGSDFIEGKDIVMQATLDEYKKRYMTMPAPMIFGGLTITSLKLAKSVCYDPSILRGEDIDYVINSHFKNFEFAFSRDLKILHLPPVQNVESYFTPLLSNKGRDTMRFIYEKLKILYFCKENNNETEKFLKLMEPYPGNLLRNKTSDMLAVGYKYIPPQKLDHYVLFEVPKLLEKYFSMLKSWPEFTVNLLKLKSKLGKQFVSI